MALQPGNLFVMLAKLLPAALIGVLFLSFEGYLQWFALLALVPIYLAFAKGCTACMEEPDPSDKNGGWRVDVGQR